MTPEQRIKHREDLARSMLRKVGIAASARNLILATDHLRRAEQKAEREITDLYSRIAREKCAFPIQRWTW